MTRRLEYTRDGFLRRISMSYDASVFLIVEGKEFDPYFADKLCSSSQKLADAGYEIRMINQIRTDSGSSAGGKPAIISFFDYCKRAGKLRQTNAGGDRVIAFIADRDGQHLTGGMRRSPHVIYTVYADVEAHIFSESDELAALAAAASLDTMTAKELLQALGDWRREVADSWRPWIELCYVADAVKSQCWVGFGQAKSLIHDDHYPTCLVSDKFRDAKAAISKTSQLAGDLFTSREARVRSKIDSIYDKNRQASLLKGKWLPTQLAIRVSRYFQQSGSKSMEWHEKGFKDSVTRCYATQIQPNAPGFRKMRAQLEALLYLF